MKSKKQLSIWMDHSTAHLLKFNIESTEDITIYAQIGEQDEALNKRDETLIQNKEQNELSAFFKRISDVIVGYDEVLLFGPTNAKTELVNNLKEDHHFDKIKIDVKPTDNMTENQQLAFAKAHFKIV